MVGVAEVLVVVGLGFRLRLEICSVQVLGRGHAIQREAHSGREKGPQPRPYQVASRNFPRWMPITGRASYQEVDARSGNGTRGVDCVAWAISVEGGRPITPSGVLDPCRRACLACCSLA